MSQPEIQYKSCPERVSKLVRIVDSICESDDSITEHVASGGDVIRQACSRLYSAINSRLHTSQSLQTPALDIPPTKGAHGEQQLLPNSRILSKNLPALPPIMDESLQETPFVHQGSLDATHSSSSRHSYERLEFLGDAYLEIIASRLLYFRYPDLSAGQLAQLRETLVKNETLAEYSMGYGFDTRARFPKHIQSTQAKTWTKLMGDIFEAYVAAVVLSSPEHGLEQAEAWLAKLWEPKLPLFTGITSVNPNAKQELAQKVMGKGTKLEYIEEKPAEHNRKEGKTSYHIGVYLTGWGWQKQHLGSGEANSKGVAGTRAAMSALKHLPLINVIADAKKDFELKQIAARTNHSSDFHNAQSGA